ncbi:hypothetical protein J7E73_03935 [Paenibacillus albidus]|uniref:Imm48 family immunity protein n=1 Tax=Paenibacillus albidus TaxID=2041023 RepID=UPI001BE8CE78|nr:Imm48 family immunity protein [Paenibacillus albidus]MBT2288298.1 hypothetical protein [Paenibacillus albidus]
MPIKQAIEELTDLANKIIEELEMTFEETNEIERQIIAVFCFGGVHAIAHREGLTPPEAHGLIIALLIRKFGYSPEQAAAFAENLIQSTAPQKQDVMNAIIHRGIDGHRQYQHEDYEGLRHNITEVLIAVQEDNEK